MAIYSHQQKSQFLRRIFGLAAVITVIAMFLAASVVDTKIIIMMVASVAVGYTAAHQLSCLTVEIDETTLQWWFGRGIWRKSIPLSEIASAEPVTNSWWWGWGIRYYGKGWLYNVSGLDAVEVVQHSAKHTRIGTDDPQGLAQALQARISGAK